MLTHSNIYHPASGSLSSAGSVSAMNVTGENRTRHCSFKGRGEMCLQMDVQIETLGSSLPLWKHTVDILGQRNLSPNPGDFSELPFHIWWHHFSRRAQRNWTGLPGLIPMSPSPAFISCPDEDVEWFVLNHHIKDRNQTLKNLQIYLKVQ